LYLMWMRVYSDLKTKKLIYDFKKEKPEIKNNKMDVTGWND